MSTIHLHRTTTATPEQCVAGTLGSPVLTPEIQKKLVDGVHAEVGSRTIEELEAERDEILLGLLELRTKRPEASSSRRRSDGIGVATRTVLAPSELPGARAAE
jgi:hypothetical protein